VYGCEYMQLEAAMRTMSRAGAEVRPSGDRRVREYHGVRYKQHLEVNEVQKRWREEVWRVLDGS
jgi:hypothetical protein